MKKAKLKILYYTPVQKKYLKNWEFYKPDIDALKKNFSVKQINSFFQFLKNFINYDIIYCVWWARSFPVIIISKLFRKKIFCTGAIHFKDKSGEKTWFNSTILYRVVNYISLLICEKNVFVSNFQKKEFKKYLKIKNGYLIKLKLSKRLDFIRIKKNNINKKKKLILTSILWHTISSYKRKGLFETLDALEILNSKSINFQFYIIGGKGNGITTLEKKIEEKKLSKNVKIILNSSFKKKLQILGKTHLYIQPSHCEAFGYAVLEASKCNTLSLISKNTAMNEIISNFGFKINTVNKYQIFKKIIEYYNLGKRQENLIKIKLKNHINKNYSLKKHEYDFVKLIKNS